ncbi:MAG TPA: trypsin-like peptidase domain-containing protein [Terriglobales bacterium]|nr:trypsin-like peptidase domain-containing protein [Terriglobales bacterium]
MKSLRPIMLALLLAASFYYLTTHYRGAARRAASEEGAIRPASLEITEAAAAPALDADEQTNIQVYRKALPSVVNITSTTVAFDFFYGPVPEQGQGSGFLLDKQGHILTNYHVVQNARQLEVTLADKRKFRAQVIGFDRPNDLAVIQIPAAEDLKAATLGDSRALVVGQKVYAIGNPFGLSGTMTRGIVSAVRPVRGPEPGLFIDEAIQTDAAINPGNSGGPLLNSQGEVIGINTFILSQVGQSAGIGFAIPINVAKAVLNDLVTFGRVRRPVLGIRTLPIGPELAAEMGLPADAGVLILQVVPGGPAERAGLKGGTRRAYLGNMPIMVGGDLIVGIDGEEVIDQGDIARVMNNRKAGDTVRVAVYRGKRRLEIDVPLGEAREAL